MFINRQWHELKPGTTCNLVDGNMARVLDTDAIADTKIKRGQHPLDCVHGAGGHRKVGGIDAVGGESGSGGIGEERRNEGPAISGLGERRRKLERRSERRQVFRVRRAVHRIDEAIGELGVNSRRHPASRRHPCALPTSAADHPSQPELAVGRGHCCWSDVEFPSKHAHRWQTITAIEITRRNTGFDVGTNCSCRDGRHGT